MTPTNRILLLFTMLLALSNSALADDDILDYYHHAVDLPGNSANDLERLANLLNYQTLEEAIVLCEQIIDDNIALQETNPLAYSKLIANLGMILNYGEYYENSLEILDRAESIMVRSLPQFSPHLISILMPKASTLVSLNRTEEARQALRQAQHITHRDDGVYSPDQLPMVNQLFELSLQNGNVMDADQQQFFTLRVSERAFGRESEALLPTLEKLGRYFAYRAVASSKSEDPAMRYQQEGLFRTTFELYDRAIKIIEDNYGPNDLRLVNSLQGVAQARLMQRENSKSEQALERALFVIERNPTTDLPDRIEAIIKMGDLYTLTSDSRASETYLRAWNLMEENPDYNWLKTQAFGAPTRLYPRAQSVVYLDRMPSKADGSKLFIDAEYTVRVDGKVGDVKLLAKNVPNEQVKRLRSNLSQARFRPRIVDGEIVETANLIIHQTFRVNEALSPPPR
ncbi:MAG: tetratricopeptide repeat protein [Pseudomonadales bacterium]|nr:tetratricopeptide repeat protein [Pseudomonadales bacterium]